MIAFVSNVMISIRMEVIYPMITLNINCTILSKWMVSTNSLLIRFYINIAIFQIQLIFRSLIKRAMKINEGILLLK